MVSGSLDQIEIDKDSTVIDVKIPIQCLVKDSQLLIHTQYKSELAGFYDPCIGFEKFLKIEYTFRELSKTVTFADKEEVKLPIT
jgi:DnaJ family protein C protein 11